MDSSDGKATEIWKWKLLKEERLILHIKVSERRLLMRLCCRGKQSRRETVTTRVAERRVDETFRGPDRQKQRTSRWYNSCWRKHRTALSQIAWFAWDDTGEGRHSRRQLQKLLREMLWIVKGLIFHISLMMRVALSSKTYTHCIWLQVFAIDKWAEQFKRLDIQLQCSLFGDHLLLRGYKCNASSLFASIAFPFRLLPAPSEVNYHLNKRWSLLAGSQRTLILFIHLQSLSPFLIHSLYPTSLHS